MSTPVDILAETRWRCGTPDRNPDVASEHVYDASPDAVWRSLLTGAHLREAMAGIADFQGLPDGPFAEGQDLSLDIRVLDGTDIPDWRMRFVRIDPAARFLVTEESGGPVARLHHVMSVEPAEKGRARLTHRFWVEAGAAQVQIEVLLARMYDAYHHRRADLMAAEAAEGRS